MSRWYWRVFPTRLAAHRQAVQEFITTRQGYRLATSTGGVLTGRGADIILIDDPLKPEEALSEAQRKAANEWSPSPAHAPQAQPGRAFDDSGGGSLLDADHPQSRVTLPRCFPGYASTEGPVGTVGLTCDPV